MEEMEKGINNFAPASKRSILTGSFWELLDIGRASTEL
jgi:hypothetical protein